MSLFPWSIIFIIGLFVYSLAGEALHFFNHFFPGVAAGFIILIIFSLHGKKTEKYELSIPFLAYFYTLIPEFIAAGRKFISGGAMVHASWEDIFLLHATFDHILEQTQLILPATAFLLFFTVFIYQRIKK